MLSFGPPWKLALVGAVAVTAGVALLLVDWTLPQLAVFVAMLFIARGALHIVTVSFEGVSGALSTVLGGAELAVGLLLLVWPHPTLLVIVVVVGALVLARGIVDVAIILATRPGRAYWRINFAGAVVEIVLGVVLIARPGGTVGGTASTLGALAILEGVMEISAAAARARRAHREAHGPSSSRSAVAVV
jgi:uncharacterized membrane protein HdeD (DUF308 family)